MIRIFGAGYWRKAKPSMSERIKYTNEPIGKVEIVQDFLPSPAELAFREEGVKVTLALSKRSVEFFKSEASKHHTQYQRMIRRLLDSYVESQEATPTTGPSGRGRLRRSRG
jgi:predicted DNA binding CopG/RHH family protein